MGGIEALDGQAFLQQRYEDPPIAHGGFQYRAINVCQALLVVLQVSK